MVETVQGCNDTSYGRDDPVEAGGSAIAELDVGVASCVGVVHLKDFNDNWVMCCARRATSIAARIKEHKILTLVHEALELDPKNQAVVCFI